MNTHYGRPRTFWQRSGRLIIAGVLAFVVVVGSSIGFALLLLAI